MRCEANTHFHETQAAALWVQSNAYSMLEIRNWFKKSGRRIQCKNRGWCWWWSRKGTGVITSYVACVKGVSGFSFTHIPIPFAFNVELRTRTRNFIIYFHDYPHRFIVFTNCSLKTSNKFSRFRLFYSLHHQQRLAAQFPWHNYLVEILALA